MRSSNWIDRSGVEFCKEGTFVSHFPKRRGFTRIDLFAIILISVLLIGLLLPAVQRSYEHAARAHCANNLRQVMLSLQYYHDNQGSLRDERKSEGHFPLGYVGPGSVPEERLSWIVLLLPYMEQEALYRQFDLKQGYAANASVATNRLKSLICRQSDESRLQSKSDALTNYVAIAGLGIRAAPLCPAGMPENGFMGYDRKTTLDMITDGTSNTLAILETRSQLGPWAKGGNSNLRGYDSGVPVFGDDRQFAGHREGVNAVFADASLRFLRLTTDPKILAAAITIAGNETYELD